MSTYPQERYSSDHWRPFLDPLAIKPHSILSILRIPIYIFDTLAISD